jgi:hypothetical protein
MNFTTKIDKMIDDAVTKHEVGKERLTPSILVLALTDPSFMEKAAQYSRYMDKGQVAMEKLGR